MWRTGNQIQILVRENIKEIMQRRYIINKLKDKFEGNRNYFGFGQGGGNIFSNGGHIELFCLAQSKFPE